MIPPRTYSGYETKPQSALVFERAGFAGIAAVVLVILGLIAVAAGFLSDPAWFYAASTAWAAALALFIIAQLLHIRAALYSLDERDERAEKRAAALAAANQSSKL